MEEHASEMKEDFVDDLQVSMHGELEEVFVEDLFHKDYTKGGGNGQVSMGACIQVLNPLDVLMQRWCSQVLLSLMMSLVMQQITMVWDPSKLMYFLLVVHSVRCNWPFDPGGFDKKKICFCCCCC